MTSALRYPQCATFSISVLSLVPVSFRDNCFTNWHRKWALLAVLSHALDLCPKWLPRQHADLAGLGTFSSLPVSLWQGTASCRSGKVRAAHFRLVQLQVLPCFSFLIAFSRDPAFMPLKSKRCLSKNLAICYFSTEVVICNLINVLNENDRLIMYIKGAGAMYALWQACAVCSSRSGSLLCNLLHLFPFSYFHTDGFTAFLKVMKAPCHCESGNLLIWICFFFNRLPSITIQHWCFCTWPVIVFHRYCSLSSLKG